MRRSAGGGSSRSLKDAESGRPRSTTENVSPESSSSTDHDVQEPFHSSLSYIEAAQQRLDDSNSSRGGSNSSPGGSSRRRHAEILYSRSGSGRFSRSNSGKYSRTSSGRFHRSVPRHQQESGSKDRHQQESGSKRDLDYHDQQDSSNSSSDISRQAGLAHRFMDTFDDETEDDFTIPKPSVNSDLFAYLSASTSTSFAPNLKNNMDSSDQDHDMWSMHSQRGQGHRAVDQSINLMDTEVGKYSPSTKRKKRMSHIDVLKQNFSSFLTQDKAAARDVKPFIDVDLNNTEHSRTTVRHSDAYGSRKSNQKRLRWLVILGCLLVVAATCVAVIAAHKHSDKTVVVTENQFGDIGGEVQGKDKIENGGDGQGGGSSGGEEVVEESAGVEGITAEERDSVQGAEKDQAANSLLQEGKLPKTAELKVAKKATAATKSKGLIKQAIVTGESNDNQDAREGRPSSDGLQAVGTRQGEWQQSQEKQNGQAGNSSSDEQEDMADAGQGGWEPNKQKQQGQASSSSSSDEQEGIAVTRQGGWEPNEGKHHGQASSSSSSDEQEGTAVTRQGGFEPIEEKQYGQASSSSSSDDQVDAADTRQGEWQPIEEKQYGQARNSSSDYQEDAADTRQGEWQPIEEKQYGQARNSSSSDDQEDTINTKEGEWQPGEGKPSGHASNSSSTDEQEDTDDAEVGEWQPIEWYQNEEASDLSSADEQEDTADTDEGEWQNKEKQNKMREQGAVSVLGWHNTYLDTSGVDGDGTRINAIKYLIQQMGVTDPEEFENEFSSAYLALQWLARDDRAQLVVPGFDTTPGRFDWGHVKHLFQRYALALLYFEMFADVNPGHLDTDFEVATEEERFNRLEFDLKWILEAEVCEWPGVTCEHHQVVALDLSHSVLQGTLPREIVDGIALPHLRSLDLSHNRIHGSLPGIPGSGRKLLEGEPSSRALEHLDLRHNKITGDIENLAHFQNLEYVDLSFNGLSHQIPDNIAGLSQLETISLVHNSFTGEIPSSMGLLTNMKSLLLDDNKLEGTVPVSLANLVKLENLRLLENRLTGSVPDEICQLTSKGTLSFLMVDCASGEITCDCCTRCWR